MAPQDTPQLNGAASSIQTLQWRQKSILLLALYLPLLLIPWIATCILMSRPIGLPSYINQQGHYSPSDLRNIEGWLKSIDVISKISGVLAVPVNSALLAQAAVRYSQRQTEIQSLSVEQLFTLADRAWADVVLLYKALMHPSMRSSLLWFGAFQIFIAAIQPPIQSLLIHMEPTMVMTCKDSPGSSCDIINANMKVIGYDPEPSDLQDCPQYLVVQRLKNKLSDVTIFDIQPHLWPEQTPDMDIDQYAYDYPITQTFFWYRQGYNNGHPFFNGDRPIDEKSPFYTASVPNGTTTGVLREHALRQQSTATCKRVSKSGFPATCGGERPFRTTFSNQFVNVDICCPGNSEKTPWTLTRNRQDIGEELWIDVTVPKDDELNLYPFGYQDKSFTVHCTSNSTRGYFELGNYHNGFVPSGLLETWPAPEDMAANFNDLEAKVDAVDYQMPPSDTAPLRKKSNRITWPLVPGFKSADGTDTDDDLDFPTPGPLMTTALAMFGNSSAFFVAKTATDLTTGYNYRRICQGFDLPFSLYGRMTSINIPIDICSRDRSIPSDFDLHYHLDEWNVEIDETLLPELVYNFMYLFSNANNTKDFLEIGMFFANEIHLTTTANLGRTSNSRAIYTGEGTQILKPRYSLAGIIVVSFLIAVQIAGLLILAIYNSSFPTWTSTLDALAMAKVGSELKELGLSPIGQKAHGDAEKLARASGLVGVVDDDKEMVALPERSPSRDEGDIQTAVENRQGDIEAQDIDSENHLRLGLGATGLISRDLVAKATGGIMNKRTTKR